MREHPILAEARNAASALQFLTRLPVPDPGWETGRLRRASRYFALVGAFIGTAQGLVWLGALWVLPPAVAAGLALGAGLLLTGALHEDGLADTADGLGGGTTRDRALEIMRDSRIGTYGAAAVVLSLGLRWAALASLGGEAGALALVIAATAGRALLVPATALAPYARGEGLGGAMGGGAGPVEIAVALGTLLLVSAAAGPAGGLAVLAAAGAGALMLWRLVARLGGYTGDGLGAIAVLAETAALIALSARGGGA